MVGARRRVAAAVHALPASSNIRTLLYTGTALLAFAANSILCRLALREATIDPASFTAVRLAAGALALLAVFSVSHRNRSLRGHGSWQSASMLFLYAACFSYAYITLSAGTGALILFGCVQATMIASGIRTGDRPAAVEWLGWTAAIAGLVWLVLPGLEAPPLTGAALMALAGVAWGVYSIRGRGESDALAATTSNFALSLALVAVLVSVTFADAGISSRGLTLAVLSGALTSGVGYVIWYAALEHLSAIQAALVQLCVPALATAGGVLLLHENLSLRLVFASALVLGGIFVALRGKFRRR